MRVRHLILFMLCLVAVAATASPAAARARRHHPHRGGHGGNVSTEARTSGGAGLGGASAGRIPGHPTVDGPVAKIIHGVAYAPSWAPIQVQRAIWAGNRIRTKPYIYGGGHGSFNDAGYDCSGSVSYLLHAAGLIGTPMDSSEFMGWGHGGVGRWITVYANPGHAFVEIAGIRFDTSREADPRPQGAPGSGPRWRPLYRHPGGFQARHPAGF